MEPVCFQHWKEWRERGFNTLPFVSRLAGESLPESWAPLFGNPVTLLLESGQSGRYTFFCDRPAQVLVGDLTGAEVWDGNMSARTGRREGRPLDVLAAVIASRRPPPFSTPPAMSGGLLGVIGYDAVQSWERIDPLAARDLPLPLYLMVECAELFVFDHTTRDLDVIVWRVVADEALETSFALARATAGCALERWRSARAAGSLELATFSSAAVSDPGPIPPPSFSKEGFESAVRRIQDYIAAGHTYQVNLSMRTSRPAEASPVEIYQALRAINPSPYMGMVQTPLFSMVCGSPELLVRVADGRISSRPIAGTRPRGSLPVQDESLSAELFASEKERAEHLMLVDLIRNDIGRVAAYGSVEVREFMVLERYSHVMHIVSQVEGQLARGATWADVFRSMFPGGTITGCPKVRTMQIIEELEPVGRGFYTGALGWISYQGAMEMNIVIRSMLVQDGVAHVQAGAGIVADSVPERELDESLRKAQALWVALERARSTVIR